MNSSTEAELLYRLRSLGLVLEARPGNVLWVSPAALLTEELRQEIRQHKQALLALLAEEASIGNLWPEGEPSTIWTRPGSVTIGPADAEYLELTTWFLARLPTLPTTGTIILMTAVAIADPERCWAYYAATIERGVQKDEVKWFLRTLRSVIG